MSEEMGQLRHVSKGKLEDMEQWEAVTGFKHFNCSDSSANCCIHFLNTIQTSPGPGPGAPPAPTTSSCVIQHTPFLPCVLTRSTSPRSSHLAHTSSVGYLKHLPSKRLRPLSGPINGPHFCSYISPGKGPEEKDSVNKWANDPWCIYCLNAKCISPTRKRKRPYKKIGKTESSGIYGVG